jgi:hypothetical protein
VEIFKLIIITNVSLSSSGNYRRIGMCQILGVLLANQLRKGGIVFAVASVFHDMVRE